MVRHFTLITCALRESGNDPISVATDTGIQRREVRQRGCRPSYGSKTGIGSGAFFSQLVNAWGMFHKRSGEVVKRFEVNIVSRREGNNLIFDLINRTSISRFGVEVGQVALFFRRQGAGASP